MYIIRVCNAIEKHKLPPNTFTKATIIYGSLFWLVAKIQGQCVFGIAKLKSHVQHRGRSRKVGPRVHLNFLFYSSMRLIATCMYTFKMLLTCKCTIHICILIGKPQPSWPETFACCTQMFCTTYLQGLELPLELLYS